MLRSVVAVMHLCAGHLCTVGFVCCTVLYCTLVRYGAASSASLSLSLSLSLPCSHGMKRTLGGACGGLVKRTRDSEQAGNCQIRTNGNLTLKVEGEVRVHRDRNY
jgi:hypothetical protein